MRHSVDYLRTLRPELGIAREATLYRPDADRSPLWVLAVDIGQEEFAGRRRTGDEYTLALVGAADVRRSAVYARAAGEAVERWALKPSSVHRPAIAAVDAPAGSFWVPVPSATKSSTYAGVLYRSDGSSVDVRVPAGAVDYPTGGPDDPSYDPSPSGTAAGLGLEDATERACKEILERDAAMRAWLEGTPLISVDTEAAGAIDPDLRRLTSICRLLGLSYAVAYLPTPHRRVRPIMAMIIDRANGVASAGLALGSSDAASSARALQEALQVRTVITARTREERTAPPTVIKDDSERARFWSSAAGVAAGLEWISAMQPATAPPIQDDAEPRWAGLIGEYTVVDLTRRLPAEIQSMGWAVAKVFAPGLQPLRMSEEHSWSVLPDVDVRVMTPHPFV